MTDVDHVEVVVAHQDCATLHVGDVFLKIDGDLAILTLGHREHLSDLVAGYGREIDLDLIRAWWSLRCLTAVRWLIEDGFDPSSPGCEVDVLRSQL